MIIYRDKGKDPLFKTWHASDEHMIIYMHSDGGSIVCSEKTYPIKRGVLCLIGAHKYHYTMPDKPCEYDRSKLFIDDDTYKKIPHIFTDDAFVYAQIDESERDTVDAIFREIKEFENDKKYFELVLLSCFLKLLVYLDKYSVEVTPSVSGAVNKAIEYINANIFNDIDIDRICADVHVSKYYFCRQFKKQTDMTVMSYILKTRIVLAKSMLEKEIVSVSEVSERCGFSSISYFCRVFKTDCGMTPLEYRRAKNLSTRMR